MTDALAARTRQATRWFGKSADLSPLSPQQREVMDALSDLLERLQPPAVNRATSEITASAGCVHVTVAHADNPDDSLLLDISDDEVVVSFGSEHEHFSRNDHDRGRVWPFDRGSFLATVVYFIELLLTGRIRVEVLRRPLQIKTRAYWLNDEGEAEIFLRGGTLLPIIGWSRTPAVEQISFMATGS